MVILFVRVYQSIPLLMKYCVVLLGLFALSGCEALAHNNVRVLPNSLSGMEMVLQIEFSESQPDIEIPTQGVIVQKYATKKTVLIDNHSDTDIGLQKGAYHYRRYGKNEASEKITNLLNDQVINTSYIFYSPVSGKWRRTIKGYDVKYGGSFIINNTSNEAIELAPANHHGKTVILSVESSESMTIPEGSFPSVGSVIFQSYQANGDYIGTGFGIGTVNHMGTYTVEKIAANTLIENTLQTIPDINYTAPFTMVYTYKTPYSGFWYQNFSDGLITFSGSFTTFDTEGFKQ